MADFPIQWPLETMPGIHPQEGGGRLINVHVDRRGGELGPVWRRVPGAVVFARTPSVGSADGHATALGVSHIFLAEGLADGHATAVAAGDFYVEDIVSVIGEAIADATAEAVGDVV